jgi:hypothetical protein
MRIQRERSLEPRRRGSRRWQNRYAARADGTRISDRQLFPATGVAPCAAKRR